jgi:hypothetical protein
VLLNGITWGPREIDKIYQMIKLTQQTLWLKDQMGFEVL